MIIKEKNRKRKTPFIISSLFLTLIVFGSIIVRITDFFSELVLPFQSAIYTRGVYVKEMGRSLIEYKQILDDNKALKAENARVEMLAEFNKNLIVENIRLKELLDMKQNSTMDFKVASINYRKPENLYERFYIDSGFDKSIEKDMIVFVDKNVVGKVREVYAHSAVVDMITGENYSVSAITENNTLGIVKGSDEENGTLYFEPNTFQDNIRVGEKIYTSGISEIYPRGLYIGEIIEVNSDSVFNSIKVRTEIDLLNITEVLIMMSIESFESEESEELEESE